ncbi:MAG: NAD(P)/FAD-dependent oxidoreductase [Dehalococcoidia bacterium]
MSRNVVQSCDVIIVGAGPAGNAAALQLSKSGLRPIVVDHRETIGDKLCTGVIGLECAAFFEPSTDIIFSHVDQVSVYSPSGEKYLMGDESNRALVVDRVSYVNSIAQEAQSYGATYLLGYRVVSIDIDQSGVEVRASHNEKSMRITAPMILIASGFGTNLLNHVNLNRNKQTDYLIGTQTTVETEHLDHIQLFTGSEIAPGSFAWLVPKDNSQALLGIVSRSKNAPSLKRLTNKLISRKMVKKCLTRQETWGIPLKPIDTTYGTRVLILGDAAGFTKPTTGGGIYYAMISGQLAAETIEYCMGIGNFDSKHLSRYQTSWEQSFGAELKTGYNARLLYECLDDNSLNKLLEKFSSIDIQKQILSSEVFSFDWHASIIGNTVRNKEIYSLLTSLGPGIPTIFAKVLKRLFLEAAYR